MRTSLVAFAALLFANGCGLLADFAPPRDDAGTGGIDATGIDATGIDATGIDAYSLVDADRIDASNPNACFRQPDGEDCSIGGVPLICLSEECGASRCGDGFIDSAAGEVCDPGGATDPLCPSCLPDCELPSDCATSECSTAECTDYRCQNVPLPDGTMCTGGVCRAGECLHPLCGNGVLDRGEECDPSSPSPACVGCRFACHGDEDCDDGNRCNGGETCEPAVGGQACRVTVPRSCAPPEPCHEVVGCEPVDGCTYALIGDADGDGYPRTADGCDLSMDCNDANPSIHPGATDICNEMDDDCDGIVDNGSATWCRDLDGDGFGAGVARSACVSPGVGFVPNCRDCWDTADPGLRALAALVRPGQTSFFTAPYPGPSCGAGGACSYDYDCSGDAEQQYPEQEDCTLVTLGRCNGSAGWRSAAPACGREATFFRCERLIVCLNRPETRTQACR